MMIFLHNKICRKKLEIQSHQKRNRKSRFRKRLILLSDSNRNSLLSLDLYFPSPLLKSISLTLICQIDFLLNEYKASLQFMNTIKFIELNAEFLFLNRYVFEDQSFQFICY